MISLAFFGTPTIAATVLESLLNDDSFSVDLVVTQPDKPVGRKQFVQPSPVKTTALKFHLPVIDQPLKTISSLFLKEQNIDLAVLFAYGSIIPPTLLDQPKYGFWNIHPSRLPQYRGASPIAYPILMGDQTTAVSLMKMDALLDHGHIISQKEVVIPSVATRDEMETLLSLEAIPLLKQALHDLIATPLFESQFTPQDHSQATYTRMLEKNDGFIPFESLNMIMQNEASLPLVGNRETDITLFPAIHYFLQKNNQLSSFPLVGNRPDSRTLFNYYRALTPWPGIWTKIMINGIEKRLKLTKLSLNQGKILIDRVQLEGKNEVDFETFQKAYQVF
ncbi:methionyl-tRNA formyltransferase [Candidatus Roizmanbacteria bacterium]|nr:methionyl-tRNA formyltransferase [Candidatus Roizmanbacteria bacterium]